ncbi:MAG: phosphoribosylglycinamide formyltransferase [Clostridiales bacterium]|nr:phosphoribosylglycinamide formyltransferase [Clostridiales bacterium]
MNKLKLAVLVSGSGTNLQAILDACRRGETGAEVALVISDRPGAYALERARQSGVACVVVPPKEFADKAAFELAMAEKIAEAGAELVILAGFMRLLTEVFLARFPQRVINIHPSLLPAFPGMHAQEQAINYGVKVAGCTVHFVDQGLDSGAIIGQSVVEVLPGDTAEVLAARILAEEHKLYPKVIGYFAAGKISVDGRKVFIKD